MIVHKATKKLIALYVVAIGTIISALVTVVFFGYLLFWPVNPLDIKTPVNVINHQVRAGEVLRYELDFCKHVDVPVLIKRTLVNDIVIVLPEIAPTSPLGCHLLESASLQIPTEIKPGKYRVDFRADYQINPLRVESVYYETEEFEVIE